jgi:AcrR family transcriptional regulator
MGRPPRIDRAAVLSAALAVADDAGLDAVTMAAVAAQVGVTPMALYRHVADKSALLDGLVEHLLEQLPPHDPTLGWADQVDAAAAALRDVARRHPAAFPLLLSRPATVSAVAVRDGVRELLILAGVAPEHVPGFSCRVPQPHYVVLLAGMMLGVALLLAGSAGRGFAGRCRAVGQPGRRPGLVDPCRAQALRHRAMGRRSAAPQPGARLPTRSGWAPEGC